MIEALFLFLGIFIGIVLGLILYRVFFKQDAHSSDVLKAEFENIALKITEEGRVKLSETGEKSLSIVVKPLEKQIDEFKKKVEESYNVELRERHLLKAELERMFQLSEMIRSETLSLTKALRGDSKFAGNWGQLTLERILESSGLRQGQEYKIQGGNEGLRSEDGQHRQIPDVIIYLPDNKHLIVDSKVSFKHYYDYIQAENSREKEELLKAHLQSIKSHIKGLSDKKYERQEKLETPDFVFLYMGLDSSLFLALDADPTLFQQAWDKNIALVSPLSLQATLRVVAQVWRVERENRNAMAIADEAGKLHDKFCSLTEDLESIEKRFLSIQKDYIQVNAKLKEGPGNLFSKVDRLKKLGAKTYKELKGFDNEDES